MVVKITWRRILAVLASLFVAGMLLAWSGIINIAASTGHWAATDWFLHWAMRNSVRTHSALESLVAGEPSIDSRSLVSASGHYAATCAICHGAPGERPSPVMQSSTPRAPSSTTTSRPR